MTERAYKNNLVEIIAKARRARIFPMAWFRDDGGTKIKPTNVWDGADEFDLRGGRHGAATRPGRE
jgi:hypothetical protein